MLNYTVHQEIPVFLRPEYRKTVDHVQTERVARQRAGKACPCWLTSKDIANIVKTYKTCSDTSRRTGIPHHVDHVVPLNGTLVCGLHVPDNLQVIPALDNIVKGNTCRL